MALNASNGEDLEKGVEVDIKRMLINEVKSRACLYDPRHEDYSKRDRLRAEWQAVGDAVGLTGNQAKKIWQQLRSYCNTHLSEAKNKSPPGSEERKRVKDWEYKGDMDFMLGFLGLTKHTKFSRLNAKLPVENLLYSSAESSSLSRPQVNNLHFFKNSSSNEDGLSTTVNNSKIDVHLNTLKLENPHKKPKYGSPLDEGQPNYIEKIKRRNVEKDDQFSGWLESIRPSLEVLNIEQRLKFFTDVQLLLQDYGSAPGPHYIPLRFRGNMPIQK